MTDCLIYLFFLCCTFHSAALENTFCAQRKQKFMLIHLLRAQQTEIAIVKHAKIKPLLQNLYVQNKIIDLASLAQMMLNTSYAGQLF